MSNNIGYIGLALVGGIMVALIAGGAYYASGDNKLTPTGMSAYGQVNQGKFTAQFGGKKTKRRKRSKGKSRKL
jgi:hypothetical protein